LKFGSIHVISEQRSAIALSLQGWKEGETKQQNQPKPLMPVEIDWYNFEFLSLSISLSLILPLPACLACLPDHLTTLLLPPK
jgi:hypothetical protein